MKKRAYRPVLRPGTALLFFGLLGWGVSSCDLCDETGCEALSEPADARIPEGIAGAIASLSDVQANRCRECPLWKTTLSVWPTGEPVTSAEAAEAVKRSAVPFKIPADGRYEQYFSPGAYLLCDYTICTAVTISPGRVTTVNINSGDGVSTFHIFEPGNGKRVTEWKSCELSQGSVVFCP